MIDGCGQRASGGGVQVPPPLRTALALTGVMRLRAVAVAGGATDFIWEFVSATVEPLLPCKPRHLYGRPMSEGRAGALDHPQLVARYRNVVERGIPQSYEQVHRIDGHQALVVHRVLRAASGVEVSLTIPSAGRQVPSAWRAAYQRAFP